MIAIHWMIAYLALGAFIGFFAGLLGIGGGGIMVPILTTVFVMQGFSLEHVVHIALATAMAAIIITSLSSLKAHHAHNAVIWRIVRQITPSILIGTFGATFLASQVSTKFLALFFASFMAYISIQMALNIKPKPSRELPNIIGMSIAGSVIGGISALVAIGGGSLSVPFMVWCNIKIQNAIGTSAAIGLPISIAGTMGYLINGWNVENMPEYTIGYIYLPAVVLISMMSYMTAPIGAKLAHSLPVPTLKKIFAVLLMLLCVKMLHTVFTS
jgi:uncharacterized membrane protein YfcA